jgi:hypothetical protein
MELQCRTKDGVLMFSFIGELAPQIFANLSNDENFKLTTKRLVKPKVEDVIVLVCLVDTVLTFNFMRVIFGIGDYIKIIQ